MAEFTIEPSSESIKSIAQLRKELKELKNVQSQAVAGSQEWTKAAARIGEIKDEFAAANEQAKIFAAGTSFEKSQNALAGLKQGITELDFGKAKESAMALNEIVKGFSAEEVKGQIEDLAGTVTALGETALNGLGKIGEGFMSMVPTMEQNKEQWASLGGAIQKNFGSIDGFGNMVKGLGSKFVSGFAAMGKAVMGFGAAAFKVGVQLLTNPIFLLATAIVLIVVALVMLMKKFGVLKTVLEITMAPLNAIIEGLKAIGDFLGLTSFAADEAAEEQKKASAKRVAALETELAAAQATYEATKNFGEEDLALFEEITGKKAAGYDEVITLERDLANERILQAQRATADAIAEFGMESEEYQKAKEEETKAVETLGKIEEKVLTARVNAAISAEKGLQKLRANAIANENERAKAMLDISEKEAVAKLESAKRTAEADLKLATDEKSKEKIRKTIKDLQESITLTQEDYTKQRKAIDDKAKKAEADANKKAADDSKKAQDERVKKALESAKKEVEAQQTKTKGIVLELQNQFNAARDKQLSGEKLSDQELSYVENNRQKILDLQKSQIEAENTYLTQKQKTLQLSNEQLKVATEENNKTLLELQKNFRDESNRLTTEDTAMRVKAAKIAAQTQIDEAQTVEESIQGRIAMRKAELEEELNDVTQTAEQKASITKKANADIAALQAEAVADAAAAEMARQQLAIATEEIGVSAAEKELEAFKGSNKEKEILAQQLYDMQLDLIEKRKQAELDALEAEVNALKAKQAAGEVITAEELQRIEGFQQAKKNIEDTYQAEADEIENERELSKEEKRQEGLEKALEVANAAAQTIEFLSQLQSERFAKESKELDKKHAKELEGLEEGTQAYQDAVDRQKIEAEDLAKAQFKAQKKMQLAAAIVDAAKAVTASLASAPVAIGPVPNPAGIFSLAFAIATSAANIAKIASSQYESAGGGAQSTPAAAVPSGEGAGGDQAAPAINLFGQGNNANTETFGNQQQTPTINVVATVSETEITATQQRVAQMNKNAEL